MKPLIDRYMDGYLKGDSGAILGCFWEDAKMISADFPPMDYSSYVPRLRGLIGKMEKIDYEFLYSDVSGFFSISADVIVGGLVLGYYITGKAERRNKTIKMVFIHFSPRPTQEQTPLAWIARKLGEIEDTGLIRDINRLELQREILRLERQNETLRGRLNRNYNLIATGRIEGLNPNTNPPIFRLVGFNINQPFFIDPKLLKELGLKNGLMIKVTEADPVRNDRGQKETRFWMVRSLEKIEVIDVDEQKP